MTGLGTAVNVAAIIIGATVGLLIKGGLSERFQDTVTKAVGLSVMFVGLSGVLPGLLTVVDGVFVSRDIMLMVGCLIVGSLLGEWIDIELRMEQLGIWCRARIPNENQKDSTFVEAFVSSSLLFSVGAMAIVGAMEDGLNHNYSILFAKAVMDGTLAIIFTASLGLGVYLSAIPVALYQGAITILSGFIKPYLNDTLVGQISMIGSILIFAIGINLIFGKRIKVGNMLPAMFLPVFIQIFM